MPTALIADDEPLLAAALQSALARLWPQLAIAAVAHDGVSALAEINRLRPDFAFLDIRMPGLDGMAVARSVAGCRVVFVTAYDEYALQAFDAAALDYLLKPIDDVRLLRCISRLQQMAPSPIAAPAPAAEAPTEYLNWITAGLGNNKRLISVDEVRYFKANDKYTELALDGETQLIRTPLKELASRLDPRLFAQIHRGLIVRLSAVRGIEQDMLGRSFVLLKDGGDKLPLSRSFAAQFKSM
ncbi:LytTR family DNA-binding domain-containing protein [Chromobacterium sp. IIBBL 290-4]|uniref:LytR/AlgR family response regulator transcription factor n=1 Tax=Chromobacterium sp. IIBBL 290-4 TaxID=2953890 RepID=UPI0020B8F800|nr:LytTR family DNA-binding domain-containing protein [Chromobacterium sp. IIBBL 290-4]UTH72887.1 LytTR family DNA-binding domain-containing protein [Chromobacterium sp. IIBBL 290-4]